MGDLAPPGERVPVWIQLRVSLDRSHQPRRSKLGRGYRPAESRRRYRSPRLRATSLQPHWLHQQRRGRHHARRHREHLQHLQRNEQGCWAATTSALASSHSGESSTISPKCLRVAPSRSTDSSPGNPVADFLLGYCSTCTGAFGSSRSTYNSFTFAPFIDDVWNVSRKMTLQLGLRWEYLAPWVEKNGLEGAFDPVSGQDRLSPGADEPAAATRSAREQPGRFLRSRHHGTGPEQLWTASRRCVQPRRAHRRAQRLRRLL